MTSASEPTSPSAPSSSTSPLSCASEPLTFSASKANKFFNEYYKRTLCINYLKEEWCSYGPNCQYAHGVEELRGSYRYKTQICFREFSSEGCHYGIRCQFIHFSDVIDPRTNRLKPSPQGFTLFAYDFLSKS